MNERDKGAERKPGPDWERIGTWLGIALLVFTELYIGWHVYLWLTGGKP